MEIFVLLFILIPAVILHECAHGWVAWRLGDPTAKIAGRLTLNPLKHIDPMGTIVLPGIILVLRSLGAQLPILGWAKPVPVNFNALRNPKRDMILVALAGPAVNIVFAIIFSQLLRLKSSPIILEIAASAVFINLLLAVFNLMPIPPLDGSRFILGILPKPLAYWYAQLEPYGLLLVVLFLYSGGGFQRVVLPIVVWLARYLGVELV